MLRHFRQVSRELIFVLFRCRCSSPTLSVQELFAGAKANVQKILNRSSILREMVEDGKIGIGADMYDVTSGQVEFYNDTMIINQPQTTELAGA